MPKYDYLAKKCEEVKEVIHPMNELGNISEETVSSMRCEGCKCTKEDFEKQLSAPSLLGFHNGISYGANSPALGEARKQARLKRSAQDFKKNILPELPADEKPHHEKRLKDV